MSRSNPGYVNARVRARKAKLFTEDDYRKLVRMGPGEIARYMEESEYSTEINELGARYDSVDLIEYALNRNQARHFGDVLSWADGQLHDRLGNYLRKFDAQNIKTAVRGVYSGESTESIQADYVRAGELDDRLLDRLAAAETVEEGIELLDETIFGDRLDSAFEAFEQDELLVPIENAIDKTFYESLLADIDPRRVNSRSGAGLYVEVLQAEIDFRNIRNALRLARTRTNMDPTEYFIEGGQLFDADELRGLVTDFDTLTERIRQSTYGDDLSAALADLSAADSLVEFENAINSALLTYADELAYRYPISVCSALAYVLAKEREVKNIRAIARGREVGLPVEEIEQEMLVI